MKRFSPVFSFPPRFMMSATVLFAVGIGVMPYQGLGQDLAASADSSKTALSSAHDPLAYGKAGLSQNKGEDKSRTIMVSSPDGMVVAAQHLAAEAGAQVLRQGGNAVDAAVAVGYALAVVYPAAGNLGGGGFMTIYLGHGNTNPGPGDLRHGRTVFVDFREHAPGRAMPGMYLDAQGRTKPEEATQGWKSVAVPGTVAGLEGVRARWGRLSREKDMAPAIALAEQGFTLEDGDVELLNLSTSYARKDPYARKIFLRPDGTAFQKGDKLVQHNLARTLRLIAEKGADAFYNGPIGEEILRASQAGGGILRRQDFSAYTIRLMAPLRCTYRGYMFHTAPPPSGGGIALCEMLNILQGYDMRSLGLHSAAAVQRQVEAMRHAYSDRRELGDPSYVSGIKGDITHLMDPAYAGQIRASIPLDHSLSSASLKAGTAEPTASEHIMAPQDTEKHETTQFSVIDRHGMAVSATYTLNGWFGSGVMGGETGIWMNDEMDDFSIKPGTPNMFGVVGSEANAIAPGKTPLSSMSPTIVTKNDRVVMVTGSPGGSRIPTIILSTVLGVVDYDLDLGQAVTLPRLHQQWMPEAIEVEEGALSESVVKQLEGEGYRIIPHQPWGMAESILVGGPTLKTPPTRIFYGVADPRHPGGAAVGP